MFRTLTNTLATRTARALALVAAFVFVSSAVLAQSGGVEDARRRWHDMPEARRRELFERYEHMRKLPHDERARLGERFGCLKRLHDTARAELSDDARRELSRLDPAAQRQALADVVSERIDEHGRILVELLPREWRERLERAEPSQRPALIEEFKRELHARALARLEALGRTHGVPEDEIAKLRRLPLQELARRLLDIEVRRIREMVERNGLPAYVSAAQWNTWKDLPPFELWRAVCEARRRADPRGEHRRDGRFERGTEDARLHRLRERLRPDPAWFIETAGAPKDVKLEVIASRLRARVLEELRATSGLVDEATLAQLQLLEGREFFEALQRALPGLGPPWAMRDSRREPHDEPRGMPPPPGGKGPPRGKHDEPPKKPGGA
jgi:hypothetical protein